MQVHASLFHIPLYSKNGLSSHRIHIISIALGFGHFSLLVYILSRFFFLFFLERISLQFLQTPHLDFLFHSCSWFMCSMFMSRTFAFFYDFIPAMQSISFQPPSFPSSWSLYMHSANSLHSCRHTNPYIFIQSTHPSSCRVFHIFNIHHPSIQSFTISIRSTHSTHFSSTTSSSFHTHLLTSSLPHATTLEFFGSIYHIFLSYSYHPRISHHPSLPSRHLSISAAFYLS